MTTGDPPAGQRRSTDAAPAQAFTLLSIGTVRHEPPGGSPAHASSTAGPTAYRGERMAPRPDRPALQPDQTASWPDRHAPHPARIEVDARYREGLLDLSRFSHVLVLWWATRCNNEADRAALRVHPRPAPEHLMGVFATRSPARPNPIAVSVCRVVEVDETAGVVRVAAIDADDGTPVVDLKPYIPSTDRVRSPRIVDWFPAQPEWACEEPEV